MKLHITDSKINLWSHIYIQEKIHIIRTCSKFLKSIYDKSNHNLPFQLPEQKN